MRVKNKIVPWLFSAPALVMYLFVVLIPVIWTICLSFFQWDGIGDMRFIGIDNYGRLFQDTTFRKSIINNLKFTLISTSYQFAIGMILAMILSSVAKFRNLLKVIYFIPCIIATVALSQIFIKLLALEPMGVFNVLIEQLGFLPQSFLGNPDTSLVTLALVDGYKYCGIYMVIFYSAFISISQDIIDAAKIDGCSTIAQFRYIKLPMIKEVCGLVLVMLINGTLKSFEMPYVLTNGGPGTSSEMVATYMYKSAFSSMKYGYSSTIAVFLLLECLLAVSLIRKLAAMHSTD